MKFKLKVPLTFGEKTVEELTLRDYTKAADYLAFDLVGGVAQRLQMIANLSGTEIELIQQLRGIDYVRATMHVDAMLADDESEALAANKADRAANDSPLKVAQTKK